MAETDIATTEKVIAVRCEGKGLIELDDMLRLQGDLKVLTPENEAKLTRELTETGFAFPFQLWREPGKTGERERFIIDGHQRLTVLSKLREQGWVVPPLPFNWVDAETKKEAMRRILQVTSQYGRMTEETLRPYLDEAGIRVEEIAEHYDLPNIDTPSLLGEPSIFKPEYVTIDSIHAHPRNYREHPEDQVAHLAASITDYGFFRNIVIARDGTILAGHGIFLAAQTLKLTRVPVIRLDLDPNDPLALKILVGDNGVSHLAVSNDRAMTEILKEIKDAGLLVGTGYDEQMLAALVMVTRPASEVKDKDDAAAWVGMPGYVEGQKPVQLIVSFVTDEDRERFIREKELSISGKKLGTWSTWWPSKEEEDRSSLVFTDAPEDTAHEQEQPTEQINA